MSKVSIVMTVYNGEMYLKEAIRSILTQTMADYEFILIDDGSTDHTKERITEFNDPRIKFYALEHVGRARALNYAVSKAQSPYIAFMDADDVAVPERLAIQLQFLEEHPDIGCVSGWYQIVDAIGKKRGHIYRLPEHHAEIEREMTKHCSLCFPAFMVRKEVLDTVGIFNEELRSAIDYEYFLRLLPVTQVANIPVLMLYHRRHLASITALLLRDQQKKKYQLAEQYLLKKLQFASTVAERNRIYFRLGINEYYYGTMKNARRRLSEAGGGVWKAKSFRRYFLPSLLGDPFFRIYRNIRNR